MRLTCCSAQRKNGLYNAKSEISAQRSANCNGAIDAGDGYETPLPSQRDGCEFAESANEGYLTANERNYPPGGWPGFSVST
jgi:hypothetical protein